MRWQVVITVLAAGVVLAERNDAQRLFDDEHLTSTNVHTSEPAFRKTIVDVLSSDKDYTLLLKALQRSRLVPTLNRINGSTLFAPTNDAIKRYAARHPDSAWAALVGDKEGNPHIALREHVFYHMLNYTATPTTSDSLPAAPATYTHRTLHFPRAPDDGSGPPSREPPDMPPWMPVPGGLLAGEPQRLRITWRDDAAWVAVGGEAENGVKVAKEDVEASNGRVVGISEVLKLPRDLGTLLVCLFISYPHMGHSAHR
jgi:solute carrier family 25 carnitine/acylcarnitine transporter 20/29